MSEAFLAMDEHTRLVDRLTRLDTSDAMERYTFVMGVAHTAFAQEMGYIEEGTPINSLPHDVQQKIANAIQTSPDARTRIQNYLNDFMSNEFNVVRTAQTVFISEEILAEIVEAAETMPDTTLIEQDVFIPNGVLVFENPMKFVMSTDRDISTETWEIKALQFNLNNDIGESDGIEVRMYGHWRAIRHNEKLVEYRWNPTSRTFDVFDVSKNSDGILVDGITQRQIIEHEALEQLVQRASGHLRMVDTTFFSFGETKIVYDEPIGALKKQLIALFRLTHEYLEVVPTTTPRPFSKRALRSKRDLPSNGYLTVLKLRHQQYEDGDGTHSSPRYAFRVRGHWKRAYLRSKGLPVGHPDAYRFVYIKDFIKGRGEFRDSTRVVKVVN